MVIWLSALLAPQAGMAYLGGFEEQDGYHTPVTTAGYLNVSGYGLMPSLGFAGDATFYNGDPLNGFISWVPPAATPNSAGDGTHGSDVTRYNAGTFGTNNGGPGGLGADIADNSGLWQVIAGGRLNDDANAPDFSGTAIQGRDHIITWRYPAPHSGAQILDVLASDVDLVYDYSLDTRDLSGLAPAGTSEQRVTMSFWYCPTDSDDGFGGNVLSLGIRDSFGQTLLEFGVTGNNELQYRVGGASLWQTTATTMGTMGWTQIIMTVDAFANTASLAAVPWSDTTGPGAQTDYLTDASLGINAGSLEKLRWSAEGGILDAGTGAVAYKNTFDDFTFNVVQVPEPASTLLVALSGTLLLRRRR